MPEGLSSTSDVRVLLNDAGWGVVIDRLLRGVGHAVNGRAAALASWIDLSETASVATEVLEPEVDKLTALAKQISAMVVGMDQPEEVLLLGEVLEQVVPVHHMHRGLESVATVVERDGFPTAIRAPWARLTHVLLILLADMGWVADQGGARRLVVTLTATGLRLETSLPGERAMAPLEARPLPPREVIFDALVPLVAGWSLSLEAHGDTVVLEKQNRA